MNEHEARPVSLELNGRRVTLAVEPRETLADALRRVPGTRSVRLGCEHGVCGACTIFVNGRSARACLMFAVQAEGCHLKTAEGLAEDDPAYQRLVRAMTDTCAFQCGFCATGMLVTATELLTEEPTPDEAAISDRLAGNLCRCTGYQSIIAGVLQAASPGASRGASR